MKKLLSLIILSAVLLSSFTIRAFAAEETDAIKSGDYTYILLGNYAHILKYTGNDTKVKVPETIDGHKVIKFGCDLFETQKYVDNTYGNEVEKEYKGKFGFAEKDVTSVTIPDSVKELGAYCFYKCKKLKNVTLSKNLTFIPREAFYGCESLASIKIPDSVKEICSDSFSKTKITSLKLPKKLSYLDTNAFYKTPLKRLTVDKDNKNYSAKDGVLYNKKKTTLIYYPNYKKAKSFTIPKSVKRVRVGPWDNNIIYLKKLIVSKNVKEIDEYAFSYAKKLKTIIFKNKKALKLYGESFSGCKLLTKVTFSKKAKTTIDTNAFCGCKKLKSVYIPKNVKIKSYGIGYNETYYNSNSYYDKEMSIIKGFTIKGKKNSPAHKYAKKNNFKFISV